MSKTLPEDQIGMVIAGLKAAACPGEKEVSVADDDLSALDQTQRLLDYIRTVPLKQRGPVIDLAYTLAQARTDAATEEAIALAEAEGNNHSPESFGSFGSGSKLTAFRLPPCGRNSDFIPKMTHRPFSQ